jgi:poly-gamma-glutamate capsule biosynthesis protein CapA/YwtB (metallophosphatase superfamily)
MQKSLMKRITAYVILATALGCMPQSLRAEEIVINAVGDIMLGGRWAPALKKKGYDFPFAGIKTELVKGDITLANLESPIAGKGSEFTGKKFRFLAEPAVAEALGNAGITLVTLANNHSMDYGGQALAETFANLEAAGIAWIGAGRNLKDARKMALYSIKDKKIAFLGYSMTQPTEFFAGSQRPGTAPSWEKLYDEDIAHARSMVDYVIVSFHWGTEGSSMPHSNQRNAAHKAIDAGADVIIGHHPHVLQGIERYKNGIIFYSLGNNIFASKSRTADLSVIIRLHLDDNRREAEILPLDVLYNRVGFQPQLLSGERSLNVIEHLNALSKPMNTEIMTRENSFFVSF